jgi:hypothetical protein
MVKHKKTKINIKLNKIRKLNNMRNTIFVILLCLATFWVVEPTKTEKPLYEVIETLGENIEIRRYQPTKWVQTSVTDKCFNYNKYVYGLYMKLYNYRKGNNDQSELIQMTVPVLTVFNSLNESLIDCESVCNMSMRFYLPKLNQENPPQPRTDAFVVQEEEMIVAVIRHGWYPSLYDHMNNRDLLIQRLGDKAKNYDLKNVMVANYDPPWRFWCRTNEVWLRKLSS